MKKALALMLALVMVFTLAACSSEEPATTTTAAGTEAATKEADASASEIQKRVDAAVAATDGKIVIITNTLSQNEE